MLLTPRATAELRRRCSSAEDAIALLLRASDPDHFTDSVVCKSRNNYFRVLSEMLVRRDTSSAREPERRKPRTAAPGHSRSGVPWKAGEREPGQSFFCFLERMLVATAISTPTPKISVPITLTCGGRPTRVEPQIHSGNVTVLPAVKLVTTKSSMDSANASRMPEKTAGRMIGKVTFQNVVHGVAPMSAAASSIERSRVTTRARTMAATNEIENMMCAITIVVKPGPTFSDTNSDSSDAPMMSSGDEIVLNMITLSVPEPRKRKRPSAYPMPVPSAAETRL